MCCISIIYILLLTNYMQINGNSLPLIAYAGPCVLWIFFFVEGMIISNLPTRNYNIQWLALAAIIALILQYIESKYLLSYGHGGVGIKLSSFIFSGIMIALLFSCKLAQIIEKASILNKILISIGNLSFGIYLIHCYAIITSGRALMFGLNENWYIRWLYVVALSYVIVYICRKLLSGKILKYIGF